MYRTAPTLEMEEAFRHSMATYSRDRHEKGDLTDFLAPLLAHRYGQQRLNVLELGPRGTTIVARTLQFNVNQYIGLDYSKSCVVKQQENFCADGVRNAYAVCGNSYHMPLANESQDLVVVSCHDPVISGTSEELKMAFSEIWRVLRMHGEFILLPWHRAGDFRPGRELIQSGKCYICTPEHIAKAPAQLFNLVEVHISPNNFTVPDQMLLVLRKDPAVDLNTWSDLLIPKAAPWNDRPMCQS